MNHWKFWKRTKRKKTKAGDKVEPNASTGQALKIHVLHLDEDEDEDEESHYILDLDEDEDEDEESPYVLDNYDNGEVAQRAFAASENSHHGALALGPIPASDNSQDGAFALGRFTASEHRQNTQGRSDNTHVQLIPKEEESMLERMQRCVTDCRSVVLEKNQLQTYCADLETNLSNKDDKIEILQDDIAKLRKSLQSLTTEHETELQQLQEALNWSSEENKRLIRNEEYLTEQLQETAQQIKKYETDYQLKSHDKDQEVDECVKLDKDCMDNGEAERGAEMDHHVSSLLVPEEEQTIERKEAILESHQTDETKIFQQMANFLKYAPERAGGGERRQTL